MRFDNINDRKHRQLLDKLTVIRDFFQLFVLNCQKHYMLDEYVIIDEKLEPFRCHYWFRKYMPKKSQNTGSKYLLWWMHGDFTLVIWKCMLEVNQRDPIKSQTPQVI